MEQDVKWAEGVYTHSMGVIKSHEEEKGDNVMKAVLELLEKWKKKTNAERKKAWWPGKQKARCPNVHRYHNIVPTAWLFNNLRQRTGLWGGQKGMRDPAMEREIDLVGYGMTIAPAAEFGGDIRVKVKVLGYKADA